MPQPIISKAPEESGRSPLPPALQPSFTPGPWNVIRDANHRGNRRVVSFHPAAVAKVYADEPIDNDNKALANAHLIASAPDLYEQVELFVRYIKYSIQKAERSGDDEGARLQSLTLHFAQAALRKARGETLEDGGL